MVDLATVIGGAGVLMVLAAALVLGGGNANYVDWPSILLVVIGSPLIVMMKFTLGEFFSALRQAGQVFHRHLSEPSELIGEIAMLSDKARKNGLLGLENIQVSDAFLRMGVAFMVDGHDADTVRSLLQRENVLAASRLERSAQVFKALADVAPALGMVGTLLGLVAMLGNLSDPSALGPAMAIAILTTLYGALIANVIALPICEKLQLIREHEKQRRALIIDGLQNIQAGHNPRLISNMLQSYLPDAQRVISMSSGRK
jgi:chemotaxis protein MotA